MDINKNGFAHRPGEFVMYRGSGIYRIDDIRKESFGTIGERTYYVMSAAKDRNSIIYAPVDAKDIELNMRHVLTPDEIDAVIGESEGTDILWVEDTKEREARFSSILANGRSSDILWLFKTLTLYRTELERNKRKLYASDAKILAAAERAITDEFSFVLDIPAGEVVPYIVSKIDNAEAV